MKEIFYDAYLAFILSCFLGFVPPFMGISMRNVALFIAAFTLLFCWNRTKTTLSHIKKKNVCICLALFSFCALLTFYHQYLLKFDFVKGHLNPTDYYTPFISILIISVYCFLMFKSFKRFSKTWIYLFIIQSIIIFISVVNSSFRLFIYDHFYFGDDRFENTIEMGTRIMGAGISAATGSLAMSTPCFLLVALKIERQISDKFYYICYMIIFSATIFIGRTGMLVEISLFLFYSVFGGHSIKKLLWQLLVIVAVIGFATFLLSHVKSEIADQISFWILSAFDNEYQSGLMNGIEKGGFPPFSEDTIMGTGITTGYSIGGKIYYPDSGYIRNWISLGVLGFMAFYYGVWKFITALKIKRYPSKVHILILFAIALMFIVEYKEPFIMKSKFPLVIFVTSLFLSRSQIIKNYKVRNNEYGYRHSLDDHK